MGKISSYPELGALSVGDVLPVVSDGATKKVSALTVSEFVKDRIITGAPQRRSTFGGKNLGSAVTAAQKAAIQSGDFEGLQIGDYWNINGVNWRIADMNYWWHTGDTPCETYHLVIMPDTTLYNAQMNETDTTEGGYMGSKMYTANLQQAKSAIGAAFPGLVLTHRELLNTGFSGGELSGAAWADSTVELPSETMLLGCRIVTGKNSANSLSEIDYMQLSMFRYAPWLLRNKTVFWMRDPLSETAFGIFSNQGFPAISRAAASAIGVRPVFAIGVA